jgi:hypothetical protein
MKFVILRTTTCFGPFLDHCTTKLTTWIHSSSLVTTFLHKLNHLMMVKKWTETCSSM